MNAEIDFIVPSARMHSRFLRRTIFPLLALAWGLNYSPTQADISLPNALPADLSEGEWLLGELNCTACHAASDAIRHRLASNPAPLLGTNGFRLNPVWLKSWLENPTVNKPGTRMPHMTEAIPAAERPLVVEALVHYLVSIQPSGDAAGAEGDPALVSRGESLYHSIGCVACHAPSKAAPEGGEAAVAGAARQSVPLGPLAAKYPATELARFLQNPVAHRPGGRMPQLNLSADEALAVATYLVREQASKSGDGTSGLVPGLKMKYYEGSFSRCADLSSAAPKSMGTSDGIPQKLPERDSNYGLVLTGLIEIPADGKYTFWTTSDDGSTLQIGDQVVVENDGTHAPRERRGEKVLQKGFQAFELRFFQGGGGAELSVSWSGPGFDRKPIGRESLKRSGAIMRPLGYTDFAVDMQKAALGRLKFVQLNCQACHLTGDANGEMATVAGAPKLTDLAVHPQSGCLADDVPSRAPKYGLSVDQRRALRKAIAAAGSLGEVRSSAAEVGATLSRLNCYACHQRGGVGGPDVHGKTPWFSIIGEADLGEEGRLPPHLNEVGAKLRTVWIERLLGEGTKVRPYMATRMPVFGKAAVGALPTLLANTDRRVGMISEPTVTDRDAKFGQKLVGRDGLSCVSCHTFAQYGSMGIPALGLERMHERLEFDWFRRYLPDPAALRPGTRMPSFWPEGKAVNTALLGGDTDAQIRAIWAWMKDGPKAEIPAGLIRGRKEIMVGDEAVIYRNFIEGAGPRAIGVGYPEHASLAFDANNLRLAMIWQGAFIDAARHSTDRGVGYEPPLGDHLFRLPEGESILALTDGNSPWPMPTHRASHGNFLGYKLDSKQRPTFRYQVDGVTIEDYPTVRTEGVDVILTRAFKLAGKSSTGSLWMRAAVGEIKEAPGGGYTVDGRVHFKFTGVSNARIVGNELRVELPAAGEITEVITW